MKKATSANLAAAKTATAIPCWECVAIPDSETDATKKGDAVYMNPGSEDYNPAPFPVRITMTTLAKPMNFVRSGGKWYLSFTLLPGPVEDAGYAVEIGEGGQVTFEEAARLAFGC